MRFFNVGMATIVTLVLMACSPTEAKPEFEITTLETYEKAPFFGALAYVDREIIRKNKVKSLRSAIRAEGDKSGIFYSYYFDRNGRLTASSPGFSPSTYHYFYDDQGRLVRTGYSERLESEVTEITDVSEPKIMSWELESQAEPHRVEVNSACYSMIAQFYFDLDPVTVGELPRKGRLYYAGEIPEFGFYVKREKPLVAEFAYEFYED